MDFKIQIFITIILLLIRLDKSTAVFKGKETSIEKYRYLVQIYEDGEFLCGGFLVTLQHVVTAAHCFYNMDTGKQEDIRKFNVMSGTSTLKDGATHSISATIWHHEYNHPRRRNNDIAIVVLSSEVNIHYEDLAKLPPPGYTVPDDALFIVLGWGMTNMYKEEPSNVLREGRVPNVNLDRCKGTYRKRLKNISKIICTGWEGKRGEDTCKGDSGGPVIYNNMVVGLIAWGINPCSNDTTVSYPGINTRIVDYLPWITNTIKVSRIRFLRNSRNAAHRVSGSVLIVFITAFLSFYNIILKYL